MQAPPMPVPGKMPTTHRAFWPAPKRYSPYVPASTSFAITVGHPNSFSRVSFSVTFFHPRFGASRMMPRSRSRGPGQPIPIAPRCWLLMWASSAASLMVLTMRSSTSFAPSQPLVLVRWEPMILKPASNTVAIIFVPPRSNPNQYRSSEPMRTPFLNAKTQSSQRGAKWWRARGRSRRAEFRPRSSFLRS